MKEIGGYLPWEFTTTFDLPYPNAYPLNLGRSGLELLVRKRQYKRVWMPVYICPVVFETLKKDGVEVQFYPLDDALDPLFSSELEPDEALLYVDYFGVKDKTVERLNRRYRRFIADLTQAFFYRNDSDFDGFNSARKLSVFARKVEIVKRTRYGFRSEIFCSACLSAFNPKWQHLEKTPDRTKNLCPNLLAGLGFLFKRLRVRTTINARARLLANRSKPFQLIS